MIYTDPEKIKALMAQLRREYNQAVDTIRRDGNLTPLGHRKAIEEVYERNLTKAEEMRKDYLAEKETLRKAILDRVARYQIARPLLIEVEQAIGDGKVSDLVNQAVAYRDADLARALVMVAARHDRVNPEMLPLADLGNDLKSFFAFESDYGSLRSPTQKFEENIAITLPQYPNDLAGYE